MKISLKKDLNVQVDQIDLDLCEKYKWRRHKSPNLTYARAWTPMVNKKRDMVYLHRLIAIRMFGKLKRDQYVDHKNGDSLDCRRLNLRIGTASQNAMNKPPHKHASKYKGVGFCKNLGLWRAAIHFNGKTKYLGTFKKEKDAAIAYDNAALMYFGEWARPNVILKEAA